MVSYNSPLLLLCAALLLQFSTAKYLAPTETLNCRPIMIQGDTFGHQIYHYLDFPTYVQAVRIQLLDYRIIGPGDSISGIMVSVCHPTPIDMQVCSDWTEHEKEMTLTRAGGDNVDTILEVAIYLKPTIGPPPVVS